MDKAPSVAPPDIGKILTDAMIHGFLFFITKFWYVALAIVGLLVLQVWLARKDAERRRAAKDAEYRRRIRIEEEEREKIRKERR
jgi:uncharacterized membrane protein